jgi:hypothetical protein
MIMRDGMRKYDDSWEYMDHYYKIPEDFSHLSSGQLYLFAWSEEIKGLIHDSFSFENIIWRILRIIFLILTIMFGIYWIIWDMCWGICRRGIKWLKYGPRKKEICQR